MTIRAVFSLLLLVRSCAALCDSPQPRLLRAEYSQSNAVVSARLLRTHFYPRRNEIEYFIYDMQVTRVLKGKVPGHFRLYQGNDSGRLPIDWKRGKDYLLFLFPTVQDVLHSSGTFSVDGCGNSGPLPEAASTLQQTEALRSDRARGGTIRGTVSDSMLSDVVLGATVSASTQGKTFRTRTDSKGNFLLRVPAGSYRVRARKGKVAFKPYIFTYEDPAHIIINDGGCAQIQFTRSGD